MKIIPTVFSKNKKEFMKRLELETKLSKEIQIDIMDGKFVKTKSVPINEIPKLFFYQKTFEAHLMVKNPEKYFDALRERGFGRIIFHYETVNEKDIPKIYSNIRKHGMQPVLAISPKTKIEKLKKILPTINHVLIMGVEPGKEHQKLIPATYSRINAIKNINPNIQVQIDGGVNEKTELKLKKAGADILNTGSFVTNNKNPLHAIQVLRNV